MSQKLAYFAGFLDGEGCFTITRKGRGARIFVCCETTYRPAIEALRKEFGGSFGIYKRKKKSNWRPTYRWSVVSRDAAFVCKSLLPFLHEKKKQAKLLLKFQSTMQQPGSKSLSESTLKIRAKITDKVRALKHVS